MIHAHDRFIKLVLWVIGIVLSLVVVSVVLFVLFRIAYQYVNTVVGNGTAVVYEFDLTQTPRRSIFDMVDVVADQYGLSRSGEIRKAKTTTGNIYNVSWHSHRDWIWRKDKPDTRVTLHIFHSKEDDREILFGRLSVSTLEAKEGDAWQVVAKSMEVALAPYVNFKKSEIQLDSRVYGLCYSGDRPHRMDAYCHYSVPIPIDFEDLNRRVLQPRALAQRERAKR